MKRLYRVHHVASAGYVDYYRYYKHETTAINALIGRGPIRQVDITHTLERWNYYTMSWEIWAIKDLSGTSWREIGALVA